MVITFLLNGVCGFLSICVMCILSAYFYNPIFIGNFSMLARQELYLYEGIKFKTAILSLITLIVLSIFLGLMYFKKYDILHKERDN